MLRALYVDIGSTYSSIFFLHHLAINQQSMWSVRAANKYICGDFHATMILLQPTVERLTGSKTDVLCVVGNSYFPRPSMRYCTTTRARIYPPPPPPPPWPTSCQKHAAWGNHDVRTNCCWTTNRGWRQLINSTEHEYIVGAAGDVAGGSYDSARPFTRLLLLWVVATDCSVYTASCGDGGNARSLVVSAGGRYDGRSIYQVHNYCTVVYLEVEFIPRQARN